jgi:hypothetical protein
MDGLLVALSLCFILLGVELLQSMASPWLVFDSLH